MKKEPFVTLEKLNEITEKKSTKHIRLLIISMMRRESVRMQKP